MESKREPTSIADATAGDGSFAGARKLYLQQGLRLTLIERLRAVEAMAETAALLKQASRIKRITKDESP